MSYAINYIPEMILKHLIESGSYEQESLEAVKQKVLNQIKYSRYPNNIIVSQDQPIEHYVKVLAKSLLEVTMDINSEELVEWQMRQAYRILNAAISSDHMSLWKFKEVLIKIHQELEASSELAPFFKSLQNADKKDIVCSGHASAELLNGYVNFKGTKTEVIMYSGVGATISDTLGLNIENDNYKNVLVEVENDSTNHVSTDFDTPHTYNGFTNRIIPNYCLIKTDVTPHVIELQSGRILLKARDDLKLQKVVSLFPNHRIHWAACGKLYDRNDNLLGPHKNKRWRMVHSSEKSRNSIRIGEMIRFYQPAKSLLSAATEEKTNDNALTN